MVNIGSSGSFILLPFWRTFSLAGVSTALGASSTSTPELSPLWLWMLESCLVFRHLATSVTSGGGEISTNAVFPAGFRSSGYGRSHARLSPATVDSRISEIDAVPLVGHLVSFRVFSLIGIPTSYNPVLPPIPPAPLVSVQLSPSSA